MSRQLSERRLFVWGWQAARHVHGGGTTASGEPICCLESSRSWSSMPSLHCLGTRRGLGVGVLRAPGHTGWGAASLAGDFRKRSVRWSHEIRRMGAATEGKETVIGRRQRPRGPEWSRVPRGTWGLPRPQVQPAPPSGGGDCCCLGSGSLLLTSPPPCSPNLASSPPEPWAKDSEQAAWPLWSLPKVWRWER